MIEKISGMISECETKISGYEKITEELTLQNIEQSKKSLENIKDSENTIKSDN